MNLEKVLFAFFIVLALTLNFGFFTGAIDNPVHHHSMELIAAIIINLIATILKFGEKSQMGAVLLATSLVADVQLIIAAGVWAAVVFAGNQPMTADTMVTIVSLSGGALLANLVSVTLLVADTIIVRR